MPKKLTLPPPPPLIIEQETEVSLLAAGDPIFPQFIPDDYKAYIRFRICTAFPNVIGPEKHGRYFGFAPGVLVASYQTLLHQQTNLMHRLKAHGAQADAIVGTVVAVQVANMAKGYGSDPLAIPETVEEAPYLDCIAVVAKIATGVRNLLGNHQSNRQKQSVSIEAGTSMADMWVYDPSDRSIIDMDAALEKWPKLLKKDEKNGWQIGKADGVQLAFACGGIDQKIPFSGVGYVPNPAEWRTAKIIDIAASELPDGCIAAMAMPDWMPGEPVRWLPIISGRDAGRGIIREVICEGSHTRHGMTMAASLADPLLDIEIAGKSYCVLRHGSRVKKII